jgi:hypothetical protein
MLKLKKGGLANVFEQDTNSNALVVEEPQPQLAPQPVYDAQQMAGVQPQPAVSSSEWGELLIRLLGPAPRGRGA